METFSRFGLIRFICCKTSGSCNPQYPSHILFDRAIVLIEMKTLFQARVISTGELAAVKVVKVEPGK